MALKEQAGARYGWRLPSVISVPIDWAEAVQITVKDVSRHSGNTHNQLACQLPFVLSITRQHEPIGPTQTEMITT